MINLPERITPDNEKLRKMFDAHAADLRVSSPGIIQSFDAGKQTVTVKLAIKERVNLNGNIKHEEIPLLVDVPVFMPRAGGYAVTLPVAAGDECLVVFGDSCMDGWWQSGGIQQQMDRRRHDLSDGYALVGLWSQPKVLSGYSPDSVQIRNDDGETFIEIKDTIINITGKTKVIVTGADEVNISANLNTIIESRVFMNHIHAISGGSNTGGVV